MHRAGVVGVSLELAAVARLRDERGRLLHQEHRRLEEVDGGESRVRAARPSATNDRDAPGASVRRG
jgi:hypothetical protein